MGVPLCALVLVVSGCWIMVCLTHYPARNGMSPGCFVERRGCLCLIGSPCKKWVSWCFCKQTFCSNKTYWDYSFKGLHSSCKGLSNLTSISVTHPCILHCMLHFCILGLKIHVSVGMRALTSFDCPDHPHLGPHQHPGSVLQFSLGGFSPLLRWATRVAALSFAPELLWGFPGPSDLVSTLPDACWITDGRCCCHHPASLTVSSPILLLINLIFTWLASQNHELCCYGEVLPRDI